MPGHTGPQLADFWVGMASIPILGTLVTLIFRNRTALSKEILQLTKKLAEHELDVANNRASNGYVKEVEDRVTKLHNKIDGKLDEVLRRIK